MNEDLFTIIFAIVVPMATFYLASKTNSFGRYEKYNQQHGKTIAPNYPLKKRSSFVPKCDYCHKVAIEKIPAENNTGLEARYYCSDNCKEEITDYINAAKKNGKLFIGLTLGSVLIMVIANGMVSALNFDPHYMLIITLIALIVIGITLIKLPFCTPLTIQLIGIKKSKIVARVLGLIAVIGGLIGLIISKFNY